MSLGPCTTSSGLNGAPPITVAVATAPEGAAGVTPSSCTAVTVTFAVSPLANEPTCTDTRERRSWKRPIAKLAQNSPEHPSNRIDAAFGRDDVPGAAMTTGITPSPPGP